jgi:succinoglycan biosynthesis protein ExoU
MISLEGFPLGRRRPVRQTLIDAGKRGVAWSVGTIANSDCVPDVSPSVDVIIAAWNRADTIERAVRSALNEREVQKVIVIDDGSDDDTLDLAQHCDAARVVVVRNSKRAGPAGARNAGFDLSTAPWIAILDGDDFFLPGRIKALLAHSNDHDFVADDLLEAEEGKINERSPLPVLFGSDFQATELDLERFVLGNVRERQVIRRELGFLKPIMRRAFLDRHGLRYDERLRLGEDYALYARALTCRARFLAIPAAGYVAVVRANSLSARHTKHDLEQLRDSDRQLLTDRGLSPGERRAIRRHYRSVDCRVQWLGVIEAIKLRDIWRLVRAFCRSPSVSLFLVRRLCEEAHNRTFARFKKGAICA